MKSKYEPKKPVELQARYAGGGQRTAHGPEPERLKIEGNWVKAVDKALRAKKPPGGWPK